MQAQAVCWQLTHYNPTAQSGHIQNSKNKVAEF